MNLLETEKQHGNCNEVSRNRSQDARGALAPRPGKAGRQRQGPAAEGYFPQRDRQQKPISRILRPVRGVYQDYEKEKRQGKQTRGETRLSVRRNAQSCRDKAAAYKVHPKLMPSNPGRYERGDGLGYNEMFGAEGRDWRRKEKWPEQKQLVESSGLLPIAAKKNRDKPDCKNRTADKI